jgi:hypothetical protein
MNSRASKDEEGTIVDAREWSAILKSDHAERIDLVYCQIKLRPTFHL